MEPLMEQENPSPANRGDAEEPTFRQTLAAAVFWMRDLMLSVVIAVLVILFLYQPVKVEGTSMMPSLVDQDRIFINKFIYRFGIGEIHRGDMVVFHYPGDPSKSYIKRVIGLPGDSVAIENGNTLVNGKAVNEPYVPEEFHDHFSMPPVKVPENSFFVMGDHRSSSNDSRAWGPVHRNFIYGKAVFLYWPFEKMGLLR